MNTRTCGLRSWLPHEIDLLRKFVAEQHTDTVIAERLGRSVGAVTTKRHELGLLKQTKRGRMKACGGKSISVGTNEKG